MRKRQNLSNYILDFYYIENLRTILIFSKGLFIIHLKHFIFLFFLYFIRNYLINKKKSSYLCKDNIDIVEIFL